MQPEDPCWVVQKVNQKYPNGRIGEESIDLYLRGEIIDSEDTSLKAIVTDRRLDQNAPEYKMQSHKELFGKEPESDYTVFSSNQETDKLVQIIVGLERSIGSLKGSIHSLRGRLDQTNFVLSEKRRVESESISKGHQSGCSCPHCRYVRGPDLDDWE